MEHKNFYENAINLITEIGQQSLLFSTSALLLWIMTLYPVFYPKSVGGILTQSPKTLEVSLKP